MFDPTKYGGVLQTSTPKSTFVPTQYGGKSTPGDAAVSSLQEQLHPAIEDKHPIFNFLLGAAKEAASKPAKAASLGTEIGESLAKTGVGKFIGEKVIKPAASALGVTPEMAAQVESGLKQGIEQTKEQFKPVGTAQNVGAFGENVAEMALTGGIGSPAIAGKAAAAEKAIASLIGKLGSKAVGLGIKAVGEGALGAGQVALQTGETKDIGTAAAISSAIPVIGAGLKAAAPVVGKVASEVLGKTTGVGADPIIEAFNNPKVIGIARKAGRTGTEGISDLKRQVLADAQRGLENIDTAKSVQYKEALGKIKATPQDLTLVASSIRDKAKQLASDFGIKFGEGKKLNNPIFTGSDIVEGQASVTEAINRLLGTTGHGTVEELDRVKKSLGRLAKGAGNGSPAQSFIYQLKNEVSTALKQKVPGYAEAMRNFHTAQEMSDEISKALSLGDKVSEDTAIRKLMSTARQDNEFRRNFLETLSEASGTDIFSKIAGIQLSPAMPRGLTGALAAPVNLGAGISSSLNPAVIPAWITYLAASSPRLVAEFTSALGKVSGKTIPAAVKNTLRGIILRSIESPETE